MSCSFFIPRYMKYILTIISSLFCLGVNARGGDISYMSSGGKLSPLQAIMDIRHYTISLDVDITNKKIIGSTEIEILLSKKTDTLLFDLVYLLEVYKIKVNNKQVDCDQLSKRRRKNIFSLQRPPKRWTKRRC